MTFEAVFGLFLLGVIGICAIALTALVGILTFDLHWLLRKLNRILPHCDETFLEARRTLTQTRQLLTRADRVARELEGAIQKTSHTASEILRPLIQLKEKTQSFFEQRFGNGARAGPRHSVRSRSIE